MESVKKWDIFELTFCVENMSEPVQAGALKAAFHGEKETVEVESFYDGGNVYKVRFMPSYEGHYTYKVETGNYQLNKKSDKYEGEFEVIAADGGNHGPVQVKNSRYLAYADGTIYHSVGTTCYAWLYQTEELQRQTLETLKNSCFNKIRFCIFPKYYEFNENEPQYYPFERGISRGQDEEKAAGKIPITFPQTKEAKDIRDFNFYKPNSAYFKKVDDQIAQLRDLGIEADIILFHPYDKWGFSTMEKACNEQYLQYMVARYSAYHNVWWSMANEYDLMPFTKEEWNYYGRLVRQNDAYGHLCSIHNCMGFFDYTEDWITHCSMQKNTTYEHVEKTEQHLEKYKKPVVWDEIGYEGNVDRGWGNISGQELVRRFWEGVLRGGCAGHGETYIHPEDILWWAKGGVLHGDSEPRLKFLKKIWDETPGGCLKAINEEPFDEVISIPVEENKICNWMQTTWCSYELHYFGIGRPAYRILELPEDASYQVEVIDTWNMTITDTGVHSGFTKVELPGQEWMAIRIIKK